MCTVDPCDYNLDHSLPEVTIPLQMSNEVLQVIHKSLQINLSQWQVILLSARITMGVGANRR